MLLMSLAGCSNLADAHS